MQVINAARIMEKGYRPAGRLDVVKALDAGGVQAWYLRDRTLVVPGTNDPNDWLRNLRFLARRSVRLADALGRGASGARWHGGFLQHAEAVYDFVEINGLEPKLIVGHSLGGAAAQIVGASLRVPTIAFATPRPKHGIAPFAGEGWVLNICREDDRICDVPPKLFGFRNIGSIYDIRPPRFTPGNDHRMEFYIRLLLNRVSTGHLPKVWPPST